MALERVSGSTNFSEYKREKGKKAGTRKH